MYLTVQNVSEGSRLQLTVNSQTSLFQPWLADEPTAQVAILAFGNLISEPVCCWKSMEVHLLHQCFHWDTRIIPNTVERSGKQWKRRKPPGWLSVGAERVVRLAEGGEATREEGGRSAGKQEADRTTCCTIQ